MVLASNSLTVNDDLTTSEKLSANTLRIGATDVTSTAAELNKLVRY